MSEIYDESDLLYQDLKYPTEKVVLFGDFAFKYNTKQHKTKTGLYI